MSSTKIEWATDVYNAFTGCDRLSPGCAHCYALDYALRLKAQEIGRAAKMIADGKPEPVMRYQHDGDPRTSGPGFGFTVHWDKLERPPRFKAGARVFVNSMSDVFHENAPWAAHLALWRVFAARPDVHWLVLTKRAERMRDVVDQLGFAGGWPEWPLRNVWLGVSIENRRFVHRADELRDTAAAVRFISAEPLLGPLIYDTAIMEPSTGSYNPCWHDDRLSPGQEYPTSTPELDLASMDWLIAGGESGKGHRRLDLGWMRALRDECAAQGTALFVKQLGGHRPGDRLEDLPEDLRIRDFPAVYARQPAA